ncbi:MAG: HrpE/YscL family type III secretion apparatus protein [Desulfovibrio sp.]|jgi:type III secretion protein L|nr:HrpE/YscL family type III secretion apparatus protein [Desulfovibrio sp.]
MGALFRLNANAVTPAPGQRVLKAADAALLHQAQDILEAARARAAELEQAARQAYDRRVEEGYRDGLEQGRLEHAEKLLETIMSSVEFIEGIEATVVRVVTEAVRKVIGDLGDDERIVRIVRTALVAVRSQQRVVVRVAPADERAVTEALGAMLQSAPGSASFLDVVADPRLDRGACLLESELGVVDASLETQLKALENAFHAKIR